MEGQYKKLYEITERENLHLEKIVETQKHMIENLTMEKDSLKAAFDALNAKLEEVMDLCDRQQQLLEEIIENKKSQEN